MMTREERALFERTVEVSTKLAEATGTLVQRVITLEARIAAVEAKQAEIDERLPYKVFKPMFEPVE